MYYRARGATPSDYFGFGFGGSEKKKHAAGMAGQKARPDL